MGRTGGDGGKSLEADIIRWKAVKGGTDRQGNAIVKPTELYIAEMVDTMCERYSKLPSEILAEDVSIIRLLHIVGLAQETDG